jgi:hypothetical protein
MMCKCCGEVHGVKDIEECHCIRREQDQMHSLWIIDGFDNFN